MKQNDWTLTCSSFSLIYSNRSFRSFPHGELVPSKQKSLYFMFIINQFLLTSNLILFTKTWYIFTNNHPALNANQKNISNTHYDRNYLVYQETASRWSLFFNNKLIADINLFNAILNKFFQNIIIINHSISVSYYQQFTSTSRSICLEDA